MAALPSPSQSHVGKLCMAMGCKTERAKTKWIINA